MILTVLLIIIIIFLTYNTFYVTKGTQKHKQYSKMDEQHEDGCHRQMQQPQPSLDCAAHQMGGFVEEHADKPYASDYSEYMISTGVEASVVASHTNFVDEIETGTTGASSQTVLSHDDSIVPKWGLRRTNAFIPIDPNSREVPSQTNEQINQGSGTLTYGLF